MAGSEVLRTIELADIQALAMKLAVPLDGQDRLLTILTLSYLMYVISHRGDIEVPKLLEILKRATELATGHEVEVDLSERAFLSPVTSSLVN